MNCLFYVLMRQQSTTPVLTVTAAKPHTLNRAIPTEAIQSFIQAFIQSFGLLQLIALWCIGQRPSPKRATFWLPNFCFIKQQNFFAVFAVFQIMLQKKMSQSYLFMWQKFSQSSGLVRVVKILSQSSFFSSPAKDNRI